MRPSTFHNKVAIVTGAASGIGRALSEELAQAGARLVLADINGPLLDKAAQALNQEGFAPRPVVLDVADFLAVRQAVS